MSDQVQNIRIRITSESNLKEATTDLKHLTDQEVEAVKAFNKFNEEAKKQEGILEKLQKEEKLLLQSRLKSTDPKAIATYNKQIESTRSQIRNLTSETQKSASGLSTAFNSVGASLVAAFSVGAITSFLKQSIEITAQFQKLEAVLTNTLGSSSAAQSALSLIKDFAATTNFSVLELTNGFVKLANAGFIPTKDELENLADVANSTGKSFDQLVEAILDANTFQFERLKEFGIKASQEGDKIRFTFKGVSTEVNKTAAEVQKYLIGLGDLEGVSGSTAAISKTLGGQISNLGDAYDSFLLAIGTNSNEGVSGGISLLNSTLTEATKAVQGNESVFTPLVNTFRASYDIVIGLAESFLSLYNSLVGTEGTTDGIKLFFEALEKGAKLALLPIKLTILGITTLIDGIKFLKDAATGELSLFSLNKLKADANKFIEIITFTDGQREKVQEESDKKQVDNNKKKEEQITEETKKQRDKRFKDALDALKREEELARRENKLAGGTDGNDLQIQESFQSKRLEIIRNFLGKRDLTYQEADLHLREIEKDYTNFLASEEAKRAEEREKFLKEKAEDDIKVLNGTLTKRQVETAVAQDKEINSLRSLFTSRKIKYKEYQDQEQQLKYRYAKQGIEDQITIDKEKLNVENITAEQRLAIEKDLAKNEQDLRDMDFAAFVDAEDKKIKKAKEREAIMMQIAKASYEAGVSIVNSLFEISSNRNEQSLIDLQAQKAEELSLVGDNEKKKDQINEKFAKKEKEIKQKQAKQDKEQALFNAAIDIATGIAKALAQGGVAGIATGALVAAAGAVQIAAIESRPVPKFFKGTEYLDRGSNPSGIDTIPILANEGERIVPTEINKKLKGIPNSELPILADIYKGQIDYVGISKKMISGESGGAQSQELLKEVKGLGKKIERIAVPKISIDKRGIRTFIEQGNSETEFINNYFRT
jgi:hypothetical protein